MKRTSEQVKISGATSRTPYLQKSSSGSGAPPYPAARDRPGRPRPAAPTAAAISSRRRHASYARRRRERMQCRRGFVPRDSGAGSPHPSQARADRIGGGGGLCSVMRSDLSTGHLTIGPPRPIASVQVGLRS